MSRAGSLDADAIAEALYAAANSGDPGLYDGAGASQRVTSSDQRLAKVRRTLTRFLEACPEEASVLEVREALDGIGGEV